MKKIILLVATLVSSLSGFAQLSLDSLGNTYVGNCEAFINAPNKNSSSIGNIGGSSGPIIGTNNYITNVVEGKMNLGGMLSISAWNGVAFAVSKPLRVSAPSSVLPFFSINVDQTVYSKNGILQSSDSTFKEDILPLPSTLDKIKALNGVTFNYKLEGEEPVSGRSATSVTDTQMDNESQRKRIGLIAQDVERVYPEVVRTLSDGSKGIFYSDLVPVLIEGIKELEDSVETMARQFGAFQAHIDSLQKQLVALQASVYSNNGDNRQNTNQQGLGNNPNLKNGSAKLYQNSPNPFNQETEIAYRLNADAQEAAISIYDLNGAQLKRYSLPKGNVTGKLQLSAYELSPGMYIYALIIDGAMIDSKRMVLE